MPEDARPIRRRRSPLGVAAGVALLLAALAPAAGAQSADPEITPDVVYGHKAGMALTFDVLQPTDARNGAGILYMVSGGWVSRWSPPERTARRFSELLDRGFTVFAVRHGSSPRFKVPEAHDDVERALRYIRGHADEFGVDADRLGVFGGSAGGHLSLMLGLDPDPAEPGADDEVLRHPSGAAAVVAYYPPVDLRPLVGPNERFPALEFDEELAPGISPIRFVSPDDPPVLLVHGDADELVPVSNSETLYEALQEEGVPSRFVTIPGGDHGFSDDGHQSRADRAMVEWFEEHLVEAHAAAER